MKQERLTREKHYVLRFRIMNRPTFEAIRTGRKKVETRAATERYRDIHAGDILTFRCGTKKFSRKVKRIRRFKTISALLHKYRVPDISPDLRTAKELRARYASFPHYRQKIARHGLMALEL